MQEELKVVKGEKVGEIYSHKNPKIDKIYTVVSVSKKGTITVETDTGKRLQYGSDGYGKGQAPGMIRKLEEGDEEQFLAERRMEWENVHRERQTREANRVRELERCREWVQTHAWDVTEVKTINCTLYIVSLPIPEGPCTLVLRFDKRDTRYVQDERYSVSISVHNTEGEYIGGGHTSTNSTEIAPLEIAAEWMSVWADVEKLEVRNG